MQMKRTKLTSQKEKTCGSLFSFVSSTERRAAWLCCRTMRKSTATIDLCACQVSACELAATLVQRFALLQIALHCQLAEKELRALRADRAYGSVPSKKSGEPRCLELLELR